MKKSSLVWIFVAAGVSFVGLVMVVGILFVGLSRQGSGPSLFGGEVGVLDLEGVILSADGFRDGLQKFRESSAVKAVVVRINSPGGGVAASQEIHRELQRFRKQTGKPVVVSMESVAASGGYYAAAPADKIFANPGTITGSIGVIISWVNYGDLLEWAKLRSVTFKSGSLKDAGNPSRDLTDAEKLYFQDLIDRLRLQFQAAVEEGRKGRLKPGALERMRDGRVVTGEEAKDLGLVDEIGDYRDAVDAAGKMAGLSLPPRVWHPRPEKPGLFELLTGSSRSSLAGRLMSGAPLGGGWNVYFLW
jgi:protease-4